MGSGPFPTKVNEPSGKSISFAGPDVFAAMVFPLAGFVSEILRHASEQRDRGPIRGIERLEECFTPVRSLDLEPAELGVHDKGRGLVKELPPWAPRASAGDAVTTPPNMPSSAPSATITPTRLTAITPSAPPHPWPVPGISSSRRTRSGGHHRPASFTICLGWRQYPITARAVRFTKEPAASWARVPQP